MRLQDKVALITGGCSGIGEAIAYRYAAEGARVVVGDIDQERGSRLEEQLREGGCNALFVELDVTIPAQWQSALDQIEQRLGPLDILVNNAGIVIPGTVESCTLEEWERVQSVNCDATFIGTQAAIERMQPRGGSIINVSSIEGLIGDPLAAAYNASKGAVRIFTKSAALHCAEQGYGIRVNSLHPGYVSTPLVQNALAKMTDSEAQNFSARVLTNIPLGRMAEPAEITGAAVFLATDDSAYMTGSELVIDGGYTAH